MAIEGLHAKRAYIEFWLIFIFCRIEPIFGTDLFWHEKHSSLIVSVDLRFGLQKYRMQKTQLSSGDLLFNEKQKTPFVSHIITVISYCCFVSTSDWGAPCDTGSKQGRPIFSFFFICFSTYFKNQNIYLKKTCSQSC